MATWFMVVSAFLSFILPFLFSLPRFFYFYCSLSAWCIVLFYFFVSPWKSWQRPLCSTMEKNIVMISRSFVLTCKTYVVSCWIRFVFLWWSKEKSLWFENWHQCSQSLNSFPFAHSDSKIILNHIITIKRITVTVMSFQSFHFIIADILLAICYFIIIRL